MASLTAPALFVLTLVVICGASDSSDQGDTYIHGHQLNDAGPMGHYFSDIGHHAQNPLLSGSGIRAFHLTKSGYAGGYHGYKNGGSDYGVKQQKGSSYQDGAYTPQEHSDYAYSPYQQYQGYKVYGKVPEYYHNQAYPYYPDYFKSGYPAYHPLPHPNYPRPYGLNTYDGTSTTETSDSSKEVESVLKVIDEREIHVHQPQDKVLYIPRTVEEVEMEEKMEKEIEEEQESSSEESEESQSKFVGKSEPVPEVKEEEDDMKKVVHDEYSEYLSGYAPAAPRALDNSFCVGLADGNFANPGLTKDADPRCTYITCAGQRPILFNCAPGTYNGLYIDYHMPVWASSSPDYKGAPHHRFEVHGRDFCGQRDIGTFNKRPVCSGRQFQEIKEERTVPNPNSVLPKDTPTDRQEDEVVYKRPEGKHAILRPVEIKEVHKIDIDDTIEERKDNVENSREIDDTDETFSEEVGEEEPDEIQNEEITGGADDVNEHENSDFGIEEGPGPIPEPDLEMPETEEPVLNQDIKSSIHSEYSDYKRGYGGSPIVLYNDFCTNMKDGNYANPGLTQEVDPRCTYVTCSSQRGYIFNCPLGTFNGFDYKHHHPVYGPDITSHVDAHHYRDNVSALCSVNDYTQVCTN